MFDGIRIVFCGCFLGDTVMPLSDKFIRNAKAKSKPYKLSDEKGLYLLVNSVGRYWRLDYRFDEKRKTLAIGVYPDVGLKNARDAREAARKLLSAKVDPAAERKTAKIASRIAKTNSFEAMGHEWFAKFSPSWTTSTREKILRRLERDVFPWMGTKSISEITAAEILEVLRRVEARGAIETAHRVHQNCGQIFRYAIATGRATRNPCPDLRGALPPVNTTHHASLTDPKKIGELLNAIEGYSGSLITRSALKLAPLVFVRPGELRKAEWKEFDLTAAEWRIPATKMKMGEQHIVPLSEQALAIVREIQPLTAAGNYVFTGARSNKRPMSENTVNAALRRLGYGSGDMTGHGFRSMASTLLNERGWNRDAIERQLAHAERNSIRAAYNYAEHLPERRRMMQAWADYLDTLRADLG